MAGSIVVFSGFQRSGKTFLAALIAQYYHNYGAQVYTNMINTDFKFIDKLSDIPLDRNPKIVLLDELHFFLNARNFKDQADFVYFINTICKRNILFLGTTIDADFIDKYLRKQMHYFVIAKKDKDFLNYKIIDVQRSVRKFISFKMCPELFNYVNYNTEEVPRMFKFDIDKFIQLNEDMSKGITTNTGFFN